MIADFFNSLVVGVKRRWRAGIVRGLSVVGALWLLTEVVTRGSESANKIVTDNGDVFLSAMLAAGFVGFFVHVFERRAVTFPK